MGKQSQLLPKPTEVELGLQVGVEFDNMIASTLTFLLMKLFLDTPLSLKGVGNMKISDYYQIELAQKVKLVTMHTPL